MIKLCDFWVDYELGECVFLLEITLDEIQTLHQLNTTFSTRD